MEDGREDKGEGEESESCHFRYRINLFTGAGLCGGVGGEGERWWGVDRERMRIQD